MKRGDKINKGIIEWVIKNMDKKILAVQVYGSDERIPVEEIKEYESRGQIKLIL